MADERTVELEMRVGDLERRLEASERRQAQTIEAVAIEIARIREAAGIPSPSEQTGET